MPSQQLLSRSVSVYLDPYFKCLIDILLRQEGYESRSDFVSDLLQYVFEKEGLWNHKAKRPTKFAFKRSPSLRRLQRMLSIMEEKSDYKPTPFEGVETVTHKNKRSKNKAQKSLEGLE